MRRFAERRGLDRGAILALVAMLLLALQGAFVASHPARDGTLGVAPAETSLCALDHRSGETPAAPRRSHCSDDCCWSGRAAPFALLPPEPARPLAGRVAADADPPPSAPRERASGWASSWSSRAPPAG